MLSKLQEEYNPPFLLNASWKTEHHYKVKVPHPFLDNEKGTVHFPILSKTTTLSDHAIHYKEVLDLMEQVHFDGDNGPYFYTIPLVVVFKAKH